MRHGTFVPFLDVTIVYITSCSCRTSRSGCPYSASRAPVLCHVVPIRVASWVGYDTPIALRGCHEANGADTFLATYPRWREFGLRCEAAPYHSRDAHKVSSGV